MTTTTPIKCPRRGETKPVPLTGAPTVLATVVHEGPAAGAHYSLALAKIVDAALTRCPDGTADEQYLREYGAWMVEVIRAFVVCVNVHGFASTPDEMAAFRDYLSFGQARDLVKACLDYQTPDLAACVVPE